MKKKNKILSSIKITYNAPLTLTFSLIAAFLLLLNILLPNLNIISSFFTCPGTKDFSIKEPLDYFRIIFHIFGHSDWNHLISNLAFILLLGPVLEEKYGSPVLLLMTAITSLVTGVLNVCFCKSALLGSSDIAFMMILLTSFTSISKKQIPLSFIFILILYIGRELVSSSNKDNIAILAHIAGGLCGSLFAFLATPKQKTKESKATLTKTKPNTEKTTAKKSSIDEDTTVVGSIEL